jgi:hypothetical protein
MADLSYVENDHCTSIQASCCTGKIADNLDRLVQGFTLGGLNMFYGAVLQMRVYATSPCGNFATCKFALVPFYPYRPYYVDNYRNLIFVSPLFPNFDTHFCQTYPALSTGFPLPNLS